MKKVSIILAIICVIEICNVVSAQEMRFLGIPFGTESRVFNQELINKGFKWITATSSWSEKTYKAELEGDFWKVRNCKIRLYSYSCDDVKNSCPISEALVILHVDGLQAEDFANLYKELISDFETKYGNFSETKELASGQTTIWHLKNGDIVVDRVLCIGFRIKYVSSIRLKQIEEENRFKGNGSSDL